MITFLIAAANNGYFLCLVLVFCSGIGVGSWFSHEVEHTWTAWLFRGVETACLFLLTGIILIAWFPIP